MKLLSDPRLFDWLIIALFTLAAIRWAWEGNWPRVGYWVGAVILNLAILAMAQPPGA